MDVARIMAEAHRAVLSADIPAELHEPAFVKAIELLARESTGDAPRRQGLNDLNEQVEEESEADPIASIATRLRFDREQVDRVFHIDGERLELLLSSASLSPAKKTATEEIALLVAAGRQSSGLDEENTDAEQIRAVAEHYRKYDSPNFSRTIKDMNDVFIIRESGRKKMLKMTQPGWEEAAKLVQRMLAA